MSWSSEFREDECSDSLSFVKDLLRCASDVEGPSARKWLSELLSKFWKELDGDKTSIFAKASGGRSS